MSRFTILYEKDDATTDTISIEAEDLVQCAEKFNQLVGEWSARMIDFQENKTTNQ